MRKRTGKNRRTQRALYRVVAAVLVTVFLCTTPVGMLTVQATTVDKIKDQIKKDQEVLDRLNETISHISDEQDLTQEIIDDLNAEIVNMLTSISLKEDEIAAKEAEIAAKEGEIAEKQLDIEQAELDYNAAKAREEEQYQAMKIRIRLMYENSGTSFLSKILGSKGLAGLINSLDIIEKVYQSDNEMLVAYEATKNEVQRMWDQLVIDKQNLEADKQQLEADRQQLEDDREHLQELKAQLDSQLAAKKAEAANYEAELKRYKADAAAAKKKIQNEQKELKKLEDQLKAQNAAINGTYVDKGYSGTIDSANGSDLGKKIAKYACQYIGNPYVYGGTSLTNGADCSGFMWRVYKNFGYSLPRTSYEQRSAGKSVRYEDAQPGDLICYDGHVGMYIGGGKLVHASNAKTGIKVSNATYRPILSVRRIV